MINGPRHGNLPATQCGWTGAPPWLRQEVQMTGCALIDLGVLAFGWFSKLLHPQPLADPENENRLSFERQAQPLTYILSPQTGRGDLEGLPHPRSTSSRPAVGRDGPSTNKPRQLRPLAPFTGIVHSEGVDWDRGEGLR